MLYLLFLLSGASGLIYQVVWVREFGNVFGNTVYSASLVIAVFMLGLGAGSYLVGAWADQRYADRPQSLLRMYGLVELVIAALGIVISLALPHLGAFTATASSYVRDGQGWYVLSTGSYAIRGAIALALLMPVTLLMGGTLTLLIRHLVRGDMQVGGSRIAALYGVNTAGAAIGCFLTDFTLIPTVGMQATQWMAAFGNLAAGIGALMLAMRPMADSAPTTVSGSGRTKNRPRPTASAKAMAVKKADGAGTTDEANGPRSALIWTSVALALSGFAAMGMELVWFRHFTLLLGGYRAVFSLLLTVILIGMGAGAFAGGALTRLSKRPAEMLMLVEAAFVASTLLGLSQANLADVMAAGRALAQSLGADPGASRAWADLWLNGLPILREVALPALLMGLAFPLANAVIQRAEQSVGRRAGLLYLANTVGAVCGSLAAGFFLLPVLGIQASATVLGVTAALSIVPLYLASDRRGVPTLAVSSLAGVAATGLWLLVPAGSIIARAQIPPAAGQTLLDVQEGVNEVVSVLEVPNEGRQLLTNGHAMSSTTLMSQRYMRALAHIPLLAMDRPSSVLVIGFGVGNTTQAVTLHPSVRRIDVADLSRQVLDHAGYFAAANHGALGDPRVAVYVNDGREHLRMQPPSTYDLITLEPPPLSLSGVGALYSRDFYALARTRLTPKGYLSQWLPAYQVPEATTLALIRAFVDVFPQAVLLSGADQELILLGSNDAHIEIDPVRLATGMAATPGIAADLSRLSLGTARDLVGTFLASPQTLAAATREAVPVTDDQPMQEYGARSRLSAGRNTIPASLYALNGVADWCPQCFFASGTPVPAVEGIDTYLALLDRAYRGTAAPQDGPGSMHDPRMPRLLRDSGYLQALFGDVHSVVGIAFAANGQFKEAVDEFRADVANHPGSAKSYWNLGDALIALGSRQEGIDALRRSIQLDPTSRQVQDDLNDATRELGKRR